MMEYIWKSGWMGKKTEGLVIAYKVFFVTMSLVVSLSGVGYAENVSPESVLGYNIGEDFKLANYDDSIAYFQALADESNHVRLVNAGKSTNGVDMYYVVISSPKNLARFDEYKSIHRRLADSRGLSEIEARALAKTTKIIVHIDGGMHSAEAADHQLPIALAHRLTSSQNDSEIDAILDNAIVVLWPTLNPEGQNMVVDWYRTHVGTEYEVAPLPWLNQLYVGNDNNRDGYMLNMIESRVVTQAQQDYSPAIFYTQHQKAPFPSRIWMPPFADPISANVSPKIRVWTNVIGTNMLAAFEDQGLPGATIQSRFDNWYPGYLDYIHVFRHSISFFTETALHLYATPRFYGIDEFPEDMRDLKPLVGYPSPWRGGWWHLEDAIRYMEVASISVLNTAVKNREQLLYNRYQAARETIAHFQSSGPYAYIISGQQVDLSAAALLVQTMIDNGVEAHITTEPLRIDDRAIPRGSWIILMDQPFAGLANELFEIQNYPDEVLKNLGKKYSYPYDATGWTLPLLMGVSVDDVMTPFNVEQRILLNRVTSVEQPMGSIRGSGKTFLMNQSLNSAFKALNSILGSSGQIEFIHGWDEHFADAIAISGISREDLAEIVEEHALQIRAVSSTPTGVSGRSARVGLYRPWRPSIDEGWTSWVLTQYGFEHTRIDNSKFVSSVLLDSFDVIIFPDIDSDWIMDGFAVGKVPPKYAGGINQNGLLAVKDFVTAGGTVIALNSSASAMAELLELPVTNCLKDVGKEDFFASGALLETRINDPSHVAVRGLSDKPVVMFTNGPAFIPKPDFDGAILATYPIDRNPLKSGILINPGAIQGKAAALEIYYGKGRIILVGFRPQWRGQSHNTYKFIFNSLYKYELSASTNDRGSREMPMKQSRNLSKQTCENSQDSNVSSPTISSKK